MRMLLSKASSLINNFNAIMTRRYFGVKKVPLQSLFPPVFSYTFI
jgi:hypothetical protein